MNRTRIASLDYWRALLVLGRVSNLPTVWSNCLAAWLLGRGGEWGLFGLVCFGATLVYLGGMFLNDAFDADFDRLHRRERPIPSGKITEKEVWRWGFSLLGTGTFLLILPGHTTSIFALLLAGCIVFYDAIHKATEFSPLLVAACRWLLFLLAASASDLGVTGLSLWSAFALAAYIIGLSYLARRESIKGPLQYWPLLALAAPLLLAWLVNSRGGGVASVVLSGFRDAPNLIFCAVLLVWIVLCLRHVFGTAHKQIGRAVSGLLAGIVLVDCLAVLGGESLGLTLVFLFLFALALFFQRFIPAT